MSRQGICTYKDHMTVEQHSITMSKVINRERERTAQLEASNPTHPLLVELSRAIRCATEDAIPGPPSQSLEPAVTRSRTESGRPATSGNRNAEGALKKLLRDVRRSLDTFWDRRDNDWSRPADVLEPPASPVRCRRRGCPIGEKKSFEAWTVENGVRVPRLYCQGCGEPYPNTNIELVKETNE